MKGKAAIYARKSTSKLGQKETIDNQIKICKRKAKELDMEIADILIDTGRGSDDKAREDVKKLIAGAVAGRYDTVIMKGVSRLYRDVEKGLGLVKRLDRSNVRVVLVEENFDSFEHRAGGTIDTSRVTMYLMFAEMEVKKLSDRVKHTQIEKAYAGEWNQPSSVPIGYKYNPSTKKLDIDYSHSPIVQLIFELYINGKGMKSIAHYLNGKNEDGVIYSTQNDKRWNEYTVGYILKNQVYCGDVVYNKRSKNERPYKNPEMLGKTEEDVYIGNDYNKKEEWIITKDAHDPIIDRETFEKVQHIISTKAQRKGIRNNTSLLAGILKCGKCEGGMTFKRGKKNDKGWVVTKDNYYCTNYIRYGKQFCTSHHIGAVEVEETVYEYLIQDLERILNKDEMMKAMGRKSSSPRENREIKKVEKAIELCIKKMDSIVEKNAIGDMSDSQFNMLNSKYANELQTLTDQLAKLKIEKDESSNEENKLDKLSLIYDDLLYFRDKTKEQQRYMLHQLIDSIIFNDGHIAINLKYNKG